MAGQTLYHSGVGLNTFFAFLNCAFPQLLVSETLRNAFRLERLLISQMHVCAEWHLDKLLETLMVT